MKNQTREFYPLIAATFFILACLHSPSALAQSPDLPSIPDDRVHYEESDAQAIDQLIMCPVCPAESIDQAQVPIARQMRQIVREQLARGATKAEILAFFVDRYGQSIIAAPPISGFNLIAWIFPVAALVAALIVSILVLRSMQAKPDVSSTVPPGEINSDLQHFLEIVDSELGIERSKSNQGGPADDG